MAKARTTKATKNARIAAGLPAKGKLIANLSSLSAEDRARAGITDAMVKKQQALAAPKGVKLVKGPYQESEDDDVITQVRVIDYDTNRVLFSGDEDQYAKLKKAIAAGSRSTKKEG